MDNIVILTGGFDPLHSGHISCIKEARKLGKVVIGLNSDEWLTRKKGKPFLTFLERQAVLKEMKDVLDVINFDDSDNTASDAIQKILTLFPENKIIFVNGGDRTVDNIPELEAFKDHPRVSFEFGVGGEDKKNSSSWILSEWKTPAEKRAWGEALTYYNTGLSKVKRLIIEPGKSISMQYHLNRNEFWFVESGMGTVFTRSNGNSVRVKNIYKHEMYHVGAGEWHRLEAGADEKLCIIEIQYGSSCSEEDIVRF